MSKNILVFCGSQPGLESQFEQLAMELGKAIAKRNWVLVYGGAKVGLMGILADSVLNNRAKVIGIIPHFLSEKEVEHSGITSLIYVNSMHERKQMMYEKSDAVVVLPGGYGTMDEMFEFLTWTQLCLHEKPIVLINANGYYDGLLTQINHMESTGFISKSTRKLLSITSDIDEAILEIERSFF